ncbi:MAG: hypothetical protein ACKOQU_12105 [Acidimicrobiaceae bacterium]
MTVVVWTLDSVRLRSIAKHLTADRHACYIYICGNSIFQSVPRKSAVFDSTIGRWQTKAPKSFDAGDTNLYRFVGNHPSYATDPSGLVERSPVTVMFRSRREFEVANEEFTQYWIGPWYGRQMKNPTYDRALQYNYGVTNESVIYALLGIDVETAESTLRTTTVYGERFGYLEVKGTTNDGEERTWYGMFEGGYGGKEHIGYTFYPSEETLRYNLSAINKLEALQSIANSWGIAASAAQLASIPLNGKLIPPKFSQQIAPVRRSGIDFVGADDVVAAEAALERMVARLKGLKSGGNHAVMEVEAFGSRAGSTWKGRGALPDSDLDIIIRDIPGAFETGAKGSTKLRKLLDDIKYDFFNETGIKVDLKVWTDDPFMRSRMAPPFKKL